MPTSDLALALIKYLGMPAVLAGIVAWLLRALLSEGLRRESDRLRAAIERDSALALERVKSEAQVQIERMRHELTRSLEEYKIRFALLQGKRLDPLAGFFSRVASICSKAAIAQIVASMESDLDWAIRIEALNSDCVLALQDYHRARVFLPKPTADKIQSLIVALRRRIIRHNSKAQNESLLKARVIFKELKHPDYNSLAEELASEFRSLLGVESDASPEK